MNANVIEERIADLSAALIKLRRNPRDHDNLDNIRDLLNFIVAGLATDRPVSRVIYTENTDKMFFGVIVMPCIVAEEIPKIFESTDPYIVKKVIVEIDSKLFDEAINLDIHEITALVVREVAHMVSDGYPMEEVKKNIDRFLVSTNQTLKISAVSQYQELLSFGIRDAMRKTVSIFEIEDKNKVITQFDEDLGIKDDLITAMKKLGMNGCLFGMNDTDNKHIVLSWVFRLYKDVLHKRIDAIEELKELMKMTPSYIEKIEFKTLIEHLCRIDDDSLLREGVFDKITGFFANQRAEYKRNGIRKYEEEFYNIQFDVQNCETQEEAMLALHRINSRMAVLDDYLYSEELTKQERDRWHSLYQNYNKLRHELSNKKIYANKTRLYVNYGMED